MIAHQREPPAGKLHPNLMAAPGMQADAHKTHFSGTQTLKFQMCVLHTLAFGFDHKNLVLTAVLEEKIRPVAPFRGCTVNHGNIFLDETSVLHGLAQSGSGGLGAGIDHHTTHVFVQTVDREDLSAQLFFQRSGEFHLRIQPYRLDAGHKTAVSIQNFHRQPPESLCLIIAHRGEF